MTPGRAALIGLMHQYALPDYPMTLLEIQKLAYFMQEAGEDLKLQYLKQTYGPYTETLHHVLQRIEGHFIRGYGDRSRGVSVALLPGAFSEAAEVFKDSSATRKRFQRVADLISGFETPYGLELLSTVHWVATKEEPKAKTEVEAAIEGVHAWSEYKRKTFQPEHIKRAWKQLQRQDWL